MFLKFLVRAANKVPARYLRHLVNWWSPLRGAGIKITYASPDAREVHVQMRLRWFNRNHVGVHFGGSLFAMTDPFYAVMLLLNLGDNYIVWDKQACIEFKKPGRDTMLVRFTLGEEEIQEVKRQADSHGKYEFEKYVEVTDPHGVIIAAVNKTLYVRRRHATGAAATSNS